MAEYVLIDFFYERNITTSNVREEMRKELGLIYDDPSILAVIDILAFKKKMLIIKEGTITASEQWASQFRKHEAFDNSDKDNPGLWQIFANTGSPRGNKKMAERAFAKAIKEAPLEEIIVAAKKYVEYCKVSGRYSMHVSSWLNPSNRQWENELPDTTNAKDGDNVFDGVFIK